MKELNPGRELDALVAEKVLGKPRVDGLIKPPDDISYGVPAYSTDIAAAWEVVEYLEKKGFSYLLSNGIRHQRSEMRILFRERRLLRGSFALHAPRHLPRSAESG